MSQGLNSLLQKSYGERGVATCADLTSWKRIVTILHIGGKGLILTSFNIFTLTGIDLGGDLCD